MCIWTIIVLTNYTNLSALNVSGKLNGATTCITTLNVIGNKTTSGLSVLSINTKLNSLSTNSTTSIDNLNNMSTTIFNKQLII